jgi:hypothetical protein
LLGEKKISVDYRLVDFVARKIIKKSEDSKSQFDRKKPSQEKNQNKSNFKFLLLVKTQESEKL